jgi:hypothetical protein
MEEPINQEGKSAIPVVSAGSIKHVKGSKTKYKPGTIVETEKGRRAEVLTDGRWKFLANPNSATKKPARKTPAPAPAPAPEPVLNEPPKKKRKRTLTGPIIRPA